MFQKPNPLKGVLYTAALLVCLGGGKALAVGAASATPSVFDTPAGITPEISAVHHFVAEDDTTAVSDKEKAKAEKARIKAEQEAAKKAAADSIAAAKKAAAAAKQAAADSTANARKAAKDAAAAARQAAADSTANARKAAKDAAIAAKQAAADSTAAAREAAAVARQATKDSLAARKKFVADSLAVVKQERADSIAERKKFLADSTATRKKFLADSIADRKKFVADSIATVKQHLADSTAAVRKAEADWKAIQASVSGDIKNLNTSRRDLRASEQKRSKHMLELAKRSEVLNDTTLDLLRRSGMDQERFKAWHEGKLKDSERSGAMKDTRDSMARMWTYDSVTQVKLVENVNRIYNNTASEAIRHWMYLDDWVTRRAAISDQSDANRVARVWDYYDMQLKKNKLFEEEILFSPTTMTRKVNAAFERDSTYQAYYKSLARRRASRLSLRFNMVGWVLGVPNLGLEIDLSKHAKNNQSIILSGAFKPKMDNKNHPRLAYSTMGGNIEYRKYWRTGGMQTIGKQIYGLHEKYTDAGFAEFDKYRTSVGEDTLRTRSRFYAFKQRMRYKKLSGRYVDRPRRARTYYLGAQAGLERYSYAIGGKGEQGTRAYLGIAGGMSRTIATFASGRSLELEFGLVLAGQAGNSEKLEFSNTRQLYELTEKKDFHITGYPVVKDLHVTVVYAFRPMANKVNQLYHVLAFQDKTDIMAVENDRHNYMFALSKQRERDAKKLLSDQEENDRMDMASVERSRSLREKYGRPRVEIIDLGDGETMEQLIFVDSRGDFHVTRIPDPNNPGDSLDLKIYHPLRIAVDTTGMSIDERNRIYEDAVREREEARRKAGQEINPVDAVITDADRMVRSAAANKGKKENKSSKKSKKAAKAAEVKSAEEKEGNK